MLDKWISFFNQNSEVQMARLTSVWSVHREVAWWAHTCPLVYMTRWYVCAPIKEKTLDSCNQIFDLYSQQPSGLIGRYCFSEAPWSSKRLGFRLSRSERVNRLHHLTAVWSWASHFIFSVSFLSSVRNRMSGWGLWLQATEAELRSHEETHHQKSRESGSIPQISQQNWWSLLPTAL